MVAYALYAGSAVVAFAISLIDLRDRFFAIVSVALPASVILLVALLMADLGWLIASVIVIGFIAANAAIYLAVNLVGEIVGALSASQGNRSQESRRHPIRRTLILWSPLPLLMVVASYVTESARDRLAASFYAIESSSWHCRDQRYFLCQHPDGAFRNSLHQTNAKFFEDAKISVRNRVAEMQTLPQSSEPVFRAAVNASVFGARPILPTKLFDRLPGCSGWQWVWPPNWGRCIKAEVLNPIHDSYADFRKEVQADLNNRITAEFRSSQTVANNLANVVQLNLDRRLERIREMLDKGIARWFFVWDVLGIISICAAALLAMKIFLYVLVRLAFDERSATVGCFLSERRDGHKPIEAMQILPVRSPSKGQFVRLQVVDQRWYVTVSCKGARPEPPGRFSWPNKPQLFFKRLMINKLFFNEYEPRAQVLINSDVSNGYCQIDLKDGDCIAFSVGRLFAFTAGVRFRLALRLRAAVLLQRRFLFTTARGPGTVILVARGGAPAILPVENDRSANIDHVIALDINGSVFTHAEAGFIDVYFRSFAVTPSKGTLMVREAPDEHVWGLATLTRRFGALLLPF